jgi:hypothetical protein
MTHFEFRREKYGISNLRFGKNIFENNILIRLIRIVRICEKEIRRGS